MIQLGNDNPQDGVSLLLQSKQPTAALLTKHVQHCFAILQHVCLLLLKPKVTTYLHCCHALRTNVT